jgi:misacylated tRNA(Ala) deacylase
MTETPYLAETARRTFTATVERRLDDRVVLDRTYFYPDGGGQPADHGTLVADGRPFDVVDVQKRDTIYHHLDTDPGDALAAGTTVEGELDWDRRHAHMRYHTAQHLLSAVLLDEFDARTTGNQLYADSARIDVAHDRFSESDLDDVRTLMNDLVDRDLPVRWYEMDRDRAEAELDTDRTRIDLLPDSIRELRIVEVGSEDDPLDRTACAGTHVASTGEVGEVRVRGRETKGSDEERVRFELA